MDNFARTAAATLAMTAGLGLAGLGVAAAAQAHPGPAPVWCPGDYWDPGWGDNWDWGGCHDNFRGDRGDFGPGDRGFDDRGRGPGFDDRGRGPGGPGGDDHRGR